MIAQDIVDALEFLKNPQKALIHQRFFKTGKGEYGEGDIFIGVTVPEIRKVAKHFISIELAELSTLLKSKIHEHRLIAAIILVDKYKKTKSEHQVIFEFYCKHLTCFNNWDLVDTSAHVIVGMHLYNKDKSLLFEWAKTDHLWTQRISIIATLYFIKKGEFQTTFNLSDLLIHHSHDLMHKAIGWMLREIGKKDENTEKEFLISRYKNMPRTMLRYAIEKFDEPLRQQFLQGKI